MHLDKYELSSVYNFTRKQGLRKNNNNTKKLLTSKLKSVIILNKFVRTKTRDPAFEGIGDSDSTLVG